MVEDKQQLRNNARGQCKGLTNIKRQECALSAAGLLTKSSLFSSSHHIACYYALENEFDTAPIIKAIWYAGKQCYLPVIAADQTLIFALYQEHTKLVPNQYHILEPLIDKTQHFSAEQLDLVFAPLLAFDVKGTRLGSGGGYYDRTFAFLKNKQINKPILLGLGYQQQEMNVLPSDEWDVSLNGVLTEEKLIVFKA